MEKTTAVPLQSSAVGQLIYDEVQGPGRSREAARAASDHTGSLPHAAVPGDNAKVRHRRAVVAGDYTEGRADMTGGGQQGQRLRCVT